MARRARSGSGSSTSSFSWRGTICHDSPNRSLSHPHGPGSRAFAVSASHNRSTSAWSSHLPTNETASVKLKSGPPLRPWNCWPLSVKSTVRTIPAGPLGVSAGGTPHLVDAAVGQQARVELGRLLSLTVEPEAEKGVAHLVLL